MIRELTVKVVFRVEVKILEEMIGKELTELEDLEDCIIQELGWVQQSGLSPISLKICEKDFEGGN